MSLRRTLLIPFSCLYGVGIALWKGFYRAGIYKTGKVPVPVISVGNVTVGGNGKTPLVIALSRLLEKRGHRVGILSRGYGRQISSDREVLVFSGGKKGSSLGERPPDPLTMGDEPALLASRLPDATIALSSNRFLGAEALCRSGTTAVVMDDGFQSLELYQDLSLVLMAQRDFQKILDSDGWGCPDLLPGGFYREGPDALLRASAVVVTLEEEILPEQMEDLRVRFGRIFERRFPETPPLPVLFQKTAILGVRRQKSPDEDQKEEILDPKSLEGKKLVLISGIARPERFYRVVSGLGAVILGHLAWKDHVEWNERRLGEIRRFLEKISPGEKPEMILTTEKDLVKWPNPTGLPYNVYSLLIESVLLEPDRWDRLLSLFYDRASEGPVRESP